MKRSRLPWSGLVASPRPQGPKPKRSLRRGPVVARRRSYCILSLAMRDDTVVLVGRHRWLGRSIGVVAGGRASVTTHYRATKHRHGDDTETINSLVRKARPNS